MKRQILLISFFSLFLIHAHGEQGHTVDSDKTVQTFNVFDIIQTPDSISESVVNIYQDKRIDQLFLERQALNNVGTMHGYRVQVFSSNIHQTAKNEAFKIEEQMREKFPDEGVYVTYSSPFWKVRVGDLRTVDEAQELRLEIMKVFPELKREMYVVRDEISLSGPK